MSREDGPRKPDASSDAARPLSQPRVVAEVDPAVARQLSALADPLALLQGLFAHSPVPYILFDTEGHPIVANAAYRAMFGAVPPPEYSVLKDEIAARLGLADLVRRAFRGETVATPTFWYDPKELAHIHVVEANRVAIACTFFPLRGADGAIAQVAVAYKDVTAELTARERVEAERDRLSSALADKERLARALWESDERLRTTLEAAEVGTWEWLVAENRVEWSPNIEAIFGMQPGEFAGTYEAWLDLVHPDDRAVVAARVADTIAHGGTYSVEFRFLRRDGTTGWQAASGHVVSGPDGKPRALRGVVFDITDGRRAQAQLDAERRRLHDVLVQAPASIAIHSATDLALAFANPSYRRLAGQPAFAGEGGEATFDPVPPLPAELLQRVARTGAPFVAEELAAQIPRAGEAPEARFFNVACLPLRDADDAIDSVVSFAVDVTEQVSARRKAESLAEALRVGEMRYRSFVSQSTEGIWRAELTTPIRVDTPPEVQVEAFFSDGYMAECNDAMAKMYGYASADEIVGARVDQLLVREDPQNTAYLQAFVASGYRLEGALSVEVDRNGARRVMQNSLVGVVEDGYVIRAWGTQRDVTEQVEAQRLAEEANRAKDEFLAVLGHELRNPLAPILTAIELMKLRDDTAFRREREIIERQVRHVVRLVDDLLDVSRMLRGKVELVRKPVDIAECVAAGVELASPLLERHEHELEVDVARGLRVAGDAGRLAQVFANILTNAAKYTAPRGHIRIRAERVGEGISVSIRDDGRGIRPEMLPRIFDPFVQEQQALDRSAGGLGLGLAIVRSLVSLHGGSVDARSDGPGKGAVFTVWLPSAAGVPERADNAERSARKSAGDGRRILIVDDNEDAAELMAEGLRGIGHEVLVVHDGLAALSLLDSEQPDIGLLDLGLPVMDGYELARRIHARPHLENVPLVAVTGYGQESDRQRATDAGFADLIVKPASLDALAAAVSRFSPAAPRGDRSAAR